MLYHLPYLCESKALVLSLLGTCWHTGLFQLRFGRGAILEGLAWQIACVGAGIYEQFIKIWAVWGDVMWFGLSRVSWAENWSWGWNRTLMAMAWRKTGGKGRKGQQWGSRIELYKSWWVTRDRAPFPHLSQHCVLMHFSIRSSSWANHCSRLPWLCMS